MATVESWHDLEYVEKRNGEKIESKDDASQKKIEIYIAKQILLQHRPIHGKEITFLRKIFGKSRREFSRELGISDVAILKWERYSNKRLATLSEIAVRVYFAKELNLSLDKVMTPLVSNEEMTEKINIQKYFS